MTARSRLAAILLAVAMAACDSAPVPTSGHPDLNLGITASLTLSGALEGGVDVDNDASSLDAGRMGCTQPDISGEVPFGIIFLGHLPGEAVASLEISIAQTQSAANVANPRVSVTFPDKADAADIDVQDGSGQWSSATAGTLTIALAGTTETGTVNAALTGGSGTSPGVSTVRITGTWSCTITT